MKNREEEMFFVSTLPSLLIQLIFFVFFPDASPEKVLSLMNVPGLTTEQISSHIHVFILVQLFVVFGSTNSYVNSLFMHVRLCFFPLLVGN